jgi:hypothetical protein
MYSRKAWGGDVEPFILTKFIKAADDTPGDPIVSLIIYEWKDEELIGIWPSNDATKVF